MIVTVILVFIILVIEFNSLSQPLTILFTVPLAVKGEYTGKVTSISPVGANSGNVYPVEIRIANEPKMSAMDKMRQMLRGENRLLENESELMENLHRPENRELHERINIEIISKISPIFAQVIEQGKNESVFDVENPLESGLFKWNHDEQLKRIQSMQDINPSNRPAPST